MPGQRLAARAGPAPPRAGGPLRVRLPRAARRRRARRSTGPAGPAADFTDLHAWAEVYVPGAGWIGLDPTSGLFAGEGHIPLACTPEPSVAAPVTGATDPCEVTLEFANIVTPHRTRTPRVTLPYTDDAVGRDRRASAPRSTTRLAAGDVRLTMGGEPTFVAVDDMEGAGVDDRRRRRRPSGDGPWDARPAPGRALRPRRRSCQHGQGKWYPGEPLPRWQIGVAVARRRRARCGATATLLADSVDDPGDADAADAAALAHALAAALGLPAERCLPAYEDPLHALWRRPCFRRATRQPPTSTHRPALADAAAGPASRPARRAIRASPPAASCPCTGRPAATRGPRRWTLRRGRLVLVAGRLAAGAAPAARRRWPGDRRPLDPEPLARSTCAGTAPRDAAAPDARPPAAWCRVERRAADRAVRRGARRAACTCSCRRSRTSSTPSSCSRVVEPSPPSSSQPGRRSRATPRPPTPACAALVVTPDPGVIEVNVAPRVVVGASWSTSPTGVHDDARASPPRHRDVRRSTAPHTGTGGGNHLTLGGPTPADSPLLRRPDLLRSLITFWQHHPSLSYLFSGRFIGPTSQAPRVDEGRDERALRARDRVRRAGPPRRRATPVPWIVDRLLRTPARRRHRQHPPGRVLHRQAVQPRHRARPARACSSCAASRCRPTRAWRWCRRCWCGPSSPASGTSRTRRRSCAGAPSCTTGSCCRGTSRPTSPRWSTTCAATASPFDPAWLAPFLEFRFPRIGRRRRRRRQHRAARRHRAVARARRGGHRRRRRPATSTRRSSGCRCSVDGMVDGRHVVTCNGVPVPLAADRHGRDRSSPACATGPGRRPRRCTPRSGSHAPLVFDLVDRWNGRSLGGCTYHVIHPGGRAYDRFPVNANEAEARRRSRFSAIGHTAGPLDPSRMPPDRLRAPDQPITLDLRRAGRVG